MAHLPSLFHSRHFPRCLVVVTSAIIGSVASGQCGTGLQGPNAAVGGDYPYVFCLATTPDGKLIAGGSFSSAGGVPVNQIAKWDGSNWSPLGTGVSGWSGPPEVRALAVLPNGDVIAGGRFAVAGGVAAAHIARWDGSAWSPLADGVDAAVLALGVLPNGDLVAGGEFTRAGATRVNHVARWDGVSWSSMGSGLSHMVGSIAINSAGEVFVGGGFDIDGYRSNVAKWSGSTWSGVGFQGGSNANFLCIAPNGDLLMANSAMWGGQQYFSAIFRWVGSGWQQMGSLMVGGASHALLSLPDGNVVAGGYWTSVSGAAHIAGIARWTGSAWSPLGSGVAGTGVLALAALPDGNIAVGGVLTGVGGVSTSGFGILGYARPGITSQPVSAATCGGMPVTLALEVDDPNATYQWRKGGTPLPGSTTQTLTLSAVSAADVGAYDCVVSTDCGTVTSATATVTLIPPPVLAAQPVDQVAAADSTVSFFVQVQPESQCASPAPFRYQWQRRNPTVVDPDAPSAWIDVQDGVQFLNAQTNALLIRTPLPALATGFRCRVEGGCDCGVTFSDVANFSTACPADFNADGGIDFSDVEAFFERWENGC